ncbi:MAG: lipopolysaccharide transport periplasmic protein LptA [Campylobacterota bacterium]|nr:lipopolysaccharide transport periplasmic protein LptA [Campylobacterota bacterium]
MIKLLLLALTSTLLIGGDLKILSDEYSGNNKKGISTFIGNVRVTLNRDRLSADKIVVLSDKENKPTSLTATGNVSFFVQTDDGSQYEGSASKAVFYPNKKQYNFFKDVKLLQLDNKKEIVGDEISVDLINSTASAKSKTDKPVMMIFDVKDESAKK